MSVELFSKFLEDLIFVFLPCGLEFFPFGSFLRHLRISADSSARLNRKNTRNCSSSD